eukprot:2328206-Pyramimonas_sp.AAC.1
MQASRMLAARRGQLSARSRIRRQGSTAKRRNRTNIRYGGISASRHAMRSPRPRACRDQRGTRAPLSWLPPEIRQEGGS